MLLKAYRKSRKSQSSKAVSFVENVQKVIQLFQMLLQELKNLLKGTSSVYVFGNSSRFVPKKSLASVHLHKVDEFCVMLVYHNFISTLELYARQRFDLGLIYQLLL